MIASQTRSTFKNIASIAKALAHPARIEIITYLSQQESCICKDIVEEVGLAQSTISQHLLELKKVGLIQGIVSGRNTCYCLHEENWKAAAVALNHFMQLPVSTIDKCCN